MYNFNETAEGSDDFNVWRMTSKEIKPIA